MTSTATSTATVTTTGTEISAPRGTQAITLTRDFHAPAALVFRCHTDPVLLAQWLGPRRLTMTVEEHDLRHGGAYHFTHTGEDGTAHGFRGVFHGTPAPELMVRTFEYEGWPGTVSLETLTMTEAGGRTTVRTVSVFPSAEDRDAMIASGMEEGVRDGDERLTELLERLQREG